MELISNMSMSVKTVAIVLVSLIGAATAGAVTYSGVQNGITNNKEAIDDYIESDVEAMEKLEDGNSADHQLINDKVQLINLELAKMNGYLETIKGSVQRIEKGIN